MPALGSLSRPPSRLTQRVRMPVQELTLGMFVSELDRPWLDSPFLIQGFRIRTQDELRQLRALCNYVYVDVIRERTTCDSTGEQYERTRYVEQVSFEEAIGPAMSIHARARQVVDDILHAVRMGQAFSTAEAKAVLAACVDNMIGNPDAMLWLTLIKNKDEYTAEHSLNVALLAIALGRQVGLDKTELNKLGLCGMLHDVGKVKVPDDILNKEGALSPEEFELMKRHTVFGKQILMQKRDLHAGVVDVAFGHHERLDGRGYPRGLNARQIPWFAKLVAVVDTYDAITSTRVYSQARSTLDALRILENARGTHFDEELVIRFVQAVGVYPAGSIAELSTGEAGIVLPTPARHKLRPKVLLVRNAEKQPMPERVFDLARPGAEEVRIVKLYPDGTFGIALRDFHKSGLVLGGAEPRRERTSQ